MMKYKVIDTRTNVDITNDYTWVITPDGELHYLVYGDLVGFPPAKVIPIVEDSNK